MLKKILGLSLAVAVGSSCAQKPVETNSVSARRAINSETEPLIRYNYKEGELSKLCQEAISSFQKQLGDWQASYSSKPGDPQGLLKFEDIQGNFADLLYPLTFMGSVSTNGKTREEASKCEEKASVFFNEVYTNRNHYQILKAVKTTNPEEARLLKELSFAFEMNGMSLNDEDLKKYKALKDRLSQLTIQFSQNLNNDVSTVSFTEEELKGAKADFLARLKKDETGKYIVSTKPPDYTAVMETVANSEVRKKMMFVFNNRQAETNTPLLQEATKVRAEIAKLMGFPTFADYALREKMATNSKAVYKFLNGLKNKLASKNKSDLKALATFKAQVLKDKSPLEIWDVPYVSNLLKIQKYSVDQEEIRQYFPATYVVNQTLDIYSQLLGVDFKQIKGAPVWAEQVELYQVTDRASKEVIAHFYADLIPREGKFGHAAAFPLISGRQLIFADGSYQKPVAAVVANFTPAAPGKPVLLSHNEVETFFHEFGHIMHQILTKAKFASLSGTNVKGDFVEAPSQMLENWVWQKDMLKKMSQHHADPSKKLPDELIARLQKVKTFNSGIFYTRQLVFGFFDMNIHTNPELDVTKEYAKVHFDLVGLKALEGTHFPATFGHMMGGYSAGYYGYLWSKVFAEDMFSLFLAKGILNPKVGMSYRQQILESGNMRDPMELIKGFLGREPNNRAFFKSLGL